MLLPLLLVLLVAVLDLTRIVRDQLLADVLARDAARYASESSSVTQANRDVAIVIDRAGRSDAVWSLHIEEQHLTVEVRLTPRTSMLIGSLRWFGTPQHVSSRSSFATEFTMYER